MLFYMCKTPDGPQLAPTQADAKKLDPSFKSIEIATDKAGLMDTINKLYLAAHAKTSQPSDPVLEDIAEEIVRTTHPVQRLNSHGLPGNASRSDHCPNCDRSPNAAKLMANSHDFTAVAMALGNVDDIDFQKEVAALALERIKQIGEQAQRDAVLTPAPRKRKA